MREKRFNIATADNHKIYGVMNGPEAGSDKAIILVHGLTGFMDEQHLIRTAYHFAEKGYDVIRFNLYGPEKDARKLEDTTLAIHALDLNTVFYYVKSKHKSVGVAGHSYGGATILHANPDTDAIVFWDSSFNPSVIWENEAIMIDGKPTVNWGCSINIGKAMYEEGLSLDAESSIELAKKITPPSLVLCADSNHNTPEYGGYFENLECEKELVIVKDCDHCFTRLGNMGDALQAMNKWFERYL